jgi:hypothetical protein
VVVAVVLHVTRGSSSMFVLCSNPPLFWSSCCRTRQESNDFSYQFGKWSRELLCMTRLKGWGSVSTRRKTGHPLPKQTPTSQSLQPFQYIVLIVNSVIRTKEDI